MRGGETFLVGLSWSLSGLKRTSHVVCSVPLVCRVRGLFPSRLPPPFWAVVLLHDFPSRVVRPWWMSSPQVHSEKNLLLCLIDHELGTRFTPLVERAGRTTTVPWMRVLRLKVLSFKVVSEVECLLFFRVLELRTWLVRIAPTESVQDR